MEKNILTSISILIKDRKNYSSQINQVLTENGNLIVARLGVNLQKKCTENCHAMIVVIVEAPRKETLELEKKLRQTKATIKICNFKR